LGPWAHLKRYLVMETPAPKSRRVTSDSERADRLEEQALNAIAAAQAEEDALDAAVRRSIALHGA